MNDAVPLQLEGPPRLEAAVELLKGYGGIDRAETVVAALAMKGKRKDGFMLDAKEWYGQQKSSRATQSRNE